jgi:hypothetical protein
MTAMISAATEHYPAKLSRPLDREVLAFWAAHDD